MILSSQTKFIVLALIALLFSLTGYSQTKKPIKSDEEIPEDVASKIIPIHKVINYPDGRPPVR